jgi:2-C-methyl-D-erythritol 4-phosphate cytidylyltransferase
MTTMLLFALLFSFLLCPPLDDDDDDDVDENDVVAICEFQNILHRFCCSKTKSTNAFFLLLLLLSSMMMMVLLLLSLLFSTSTTSRCAKVDKMEKLFSTFCIIVIAGFRLEFVFFTRNARSVYSQNQPFFVYREESDWYLYFAMTTMSINIAMCKHSSSFPSKVSPSSGRKQSIGFGYRAGGSMKAFKPNASSTDANNVEDNSVTLVLLAGGVGKRMGANMPKQYLPLLDVPIAVYSLRKFATMREIGEIVVVCNEEYDDVFTSEKISKPLVIARPGAERQDSVYNGITKARKETKLLAIHDSARPLTDLEDARRCFEDGAKFGAAVLAVKCKATIKQANKDGSIDKTLDRSLLWEMQTPQVIEPNLLKEGFQYVKENGLEVTDDVSVVEHLGKRVQITEGSYYNIKVTTPEDMFIAERLLNEEPKLRCV